MISVNREMQLCTPVCNLYTRACYTEKVVNPGSRE